MAESTSPVARFFDRVSRVYDSSLLQSLLYRPGQDLALEELRTAGSRRVVDVGCGTGIFAARLRSELAAELVCGCDLSEGMLRRAAARSDRVEWIKADSGRLPLGGESVDAVVCTEAFHFFDQPAALAEFRRVLVPAGLLLVAMINPRTDAGSRFLRAQLRGLGAATWPSRSGMRQLVADAGFDVQAQRRVSRVMGRLIPTYLTVARRSL